MKRDEAIAQLNDRATALKAMGATSLYVFGSTVRNEASESSAAVAKPLAASAP